MTAILRVLLAAACVAWASVPAAAQAPLGATAASARVLGEMAGTWDVAQRMWTGPGAKAIDLPPATAQRTVAAGGGFVEEVMTLAGGAAGAPFTRTAHLNYNPVEGVFEYFSIDSRAPQQMRYASPPAAPGYSGPFAFKGGTFVAAEWGGQRNVAFAYRVELSPVAAGKQTLALFLRPLASRNRREFQAFEYVYRRR